MNLQMGAMGARIAEVRHADVDARVTVRDNLEDSIVVCVCGTCCSKIGDNRRVDGEVVRWMV
jgi:hypothetical protein